MKATGWRLVALVSLYVPVHFIPLIDLTNSGDNKSFPLDFYFSLLLLLGIILCWKTHMTTDLLGWLFPWGTEFERYVSILPLSCVSLFL